MAPTTKGRPAATRRPFQTQRRDNGNQIDAPRGGTMYTDQSTREEPLHHRGDLVLVKLPDKPPMFGIVRDTNSDDPTRTYLIATDDPDNLLLVAAEHVHPVHVGRQYMDIEDVNRRCVERAVAGLDLKKVGRFQPGVAE